jgi:preprotein translocase subunit SecY
MQLLSVLSRIPELRKRVLFTLGMLAVYRVGVFVSSPGIDVARLRGQFAASGGGLFGLVNMFSGGALENFSIFTLGISPYISISIIIQLLSPAVPFLEALRKEGAAGRRVLTRYTRVGTIILASLQGYLISVGLENQGFALSPGLLFRLNTAVTLCAGTAFMMWLGEQITERGIGNGTSIIIFAGIVARMPLVLISTVALAQNGAIPATAVLALIIFSVLTVAGIVYVEKSQRKVLVQYPRRTINNRSTQPTTQFIPLKVNMASVIPPIFASAILVIPTYLLGFSASEGVRDFVSLLVPGAWIYEVLFAALIIVFSFFYTSVVFNPDEVAENLKKNGGFIPAVRPGRETADYLFGILNRLTLWGALYCAAICIGPQLIYISLGVRDFAYVFGGTAVLIVVGVTLDTAAQIQSMVVARNYEDFMAQSSSGRARFDGQAKSKRRLLRRG